MKIKRIFALVLVLLLTFSGCAKGSSDEEELPIVPVSEGYDASEIRNNSALRIPFDYREGVSPYKTTSKPNRYVCGLIYRSIVKLTSSYNYEADLASEITSKDNIEWYIYIDDGLSFPNGKEFTAYDIKYSIQQAMKENSFFHSSLNTVDSIIVVNATCCKVVLTEANRYFPNLLTFPVISFETEDDPVFFPGRYSLSDDREKLTANGDYAIKEIELVPFTDKDLLVYEMKMGIYSSIYCSDPLDLGTSSIGGIGGLQTNRLVYLELNSGSPFLYYSDFRKAVSAAIDYGYISSEIYGNFASVPRNVFNPDFYEMQFTSRRSLDLMSANLLLDEMGLDKLDSDGFRTGKSGKRIVLDLLVCNSNKTKVSAANAIAEMLKEIEIDVNINSVSYSSYLVAIENYDYDMYIGEIKIDNDMDISGLFAPKDSYGYSSSPKERIYYNWLDFMAGNISISEFSDKFDDELPLVPLCYTKSCVIYSRDLSFTFGGTDFDMFYNITDWENR